jgi:hypothetical protein
MELCCNFCNVRLALILLKISIFLFTFLNKKIESNWRSFFIKYIIWTVNAIQKLYKTKKKNKDILIFFLHIVMKVTLFYTQNRSESSPFLHEKS